MQNVRLEVERVYIVHIQGVHMPESRSRLRAAVDRGRKSR